jgi:hypothetical protein
MKWAGWEKARNGQESESSSLLADGGGWLATVLFAGSSRTGTGKPQVGRASDKRAMEPEDGGRNAGKRPDCLACFRGNLQPLSAANRFWSHALRQETISAQVARQVLTIEGKNCRCFGALTIFISRLPGNLYTQFDTVGEFIGGAALGSLLGCESSKVRNSCLLHFFSC